MPSRIVCKGTAAAVAARRIRNILGPVMLKGERTCSIHSVQSKFLNTSAGNTHPSGFSNLISKCIDPVYKSKSRACSFQRQYEVETSREGENPVWQKGSI